MDVTKEKLVFAVAALVTVLSLRTIRTPSTEAVPPLPAEEGPRPPRVTVPVPPLRPEKGLEANARDPFVPASAWAPATPALLALPPVPSSPRVLPGGSPPGIRARTVVVDRAPTAQPDEPDVPKPDPGKGGGK